MIPYALTRGVRRIVLLFGAWLNTRRCVALAGLRETSSGDPDSGPFFEAVLVRRRPPRLGCVVVLALVIAAAIPAGDAAAFAAAPASGVTVAHSGDEGAQSSADDDDQATDEGALQVEVIALPTDRQAKIKVVGPAHFSRKVKRSTVIRGLDAGLYSITARSIPLGTASLAPTVTDSPVRVEAGKTATVVVNYGNVLPNTTKAVAPSAVSEVVGGVGGPQTLVLTVDAARRLAVGDVVGIDVGPQTPDGFLGKVTAIRHAGGGVMIDTAPAALFEAITRGSFSVSDPPPPIVRFFDKNFECGPSAFHADYGLTIVPDWELSIEWDGATVNRARAVLSAAEQVTLEGRLAGGATCDFGPLSLLPAPISLGYRTIYIGGFPVVISTKLDVDVDGSVGLTAGFTGSITQNATFAAGLRYEGGELLPIASVTNSWSASAPDPDTLLEGTLAVGVGPTVQFLLWGLAGPEITTHTPGFELKATPLGCPSWKLTGAMTVGGGLTFPAFAFDKRKSDIISISTVLAQSPPRLKLIPAHGPAGTTVVAEGCAFRPGELVDLSADGIPAGSVVADVDGKFSASFSIPGSATPGPVTVRASGASGDGASASFTVENTFSLTVTKLGTGGGTVTSAPAGINCGSTCSATFPQGGAVVLSANPAAGSTFMNWGQDCAGTSPSTTIVMGGDRSCTANFAIGTPPPTPASFVASTSNTTSVLLTWSATPTATYYELFRFTAKVRVPAPETSFLFANLMPGTSYHFNIRACNDFGCSPLFGEIGCTPGFC